MIKESAENPVNKGLSADIFIQWEQNGNIFRFFSSFLTNKDHSNGRKLHRADLDISVSRSEASSEYFRDQDAQRPVVERTPSQ